jgi:hypothetical protein
MSSKFAIPNITIMSYLIITSELLGELTDEQKECISGGTDFKLGNTNFAERDSGVLESNASNPMSNSNFSFKLNRVIYTAGQELLGLGGKIPHNITTLPPPPIF